jgi:hypothetical protein
MDRLFLGKHFQDKAESYKRMIFYIISIQHKQHIYQVLK